MAEKALIDTYAIVAYLAGYIPETAKEVIDRIRGGKARGVIHYLLVYELAYHWRKRKIPSSSEKELLEFVKLYFEVEDLTPDVAIEASNLKLKGDEVLRKNPELRRRRLSAADATTIAIALRKNLPIVTGDKDLSFVARKMGVEVIWD